MTTTALAADKQQERGQIFIASTSRCHFGVLGWTASFFLQLSPVKIIAQIAQLTVGSLSLFLCGSFSYLLNCYHITIADVTQIRQRRHDYGTPLRLPAAVDADTHTQTAHSHRFLSSKNKLRDLLR